MISRMAPSPSRHGTLPRPIAATLDAARTAWLARPDTSALRFQLLDLLRLLETKNGSRRSARADPLPWIGP